ncbi:MAG: Wzz/FepE/Etk N-terminal domain-containing protein [Roseiarcus sp.]|jgi:uncharacterized protein involved in exopolysaccharide biosynthesis
MFEYGPTAAEASGGDARPPLAAGSARDRALAVVEIAKRHKAFTLGCALACALLGFAASKALTPRYVAVTQIYVDPGALPGAGTDAPAPGQDSNGFINYVESQSLIITSRAVLERVVANEKLDADPDFFGAWRFPALLGSSPDASDRAAAAAAALGTRIQVKRPERTFIIDLSVSDRDPIKAAELANATARAYIDVSSSWQSDASRQTETSLAGRLEVLRKRVLDAEKKVEDFKADNGLVGTRDLLVTEQQLKDMNAQMMIARAKAAEARARLDQIENAHRRGGDIAALASQITSASLAALRTQQALTRQRLADLTGELGPRHPQVIDARARVSVADAAVDAEVMRFAQSQRIEYESAKQLEASLSRQLDELKTQSNANGQSSVGLRDLEREADAARSVYELFVTRSREAGEIQQVEPTRSRIISLATAPKSRAFPPSGALMATAGLLLGLGLGVAGSLARERRAFAAPPDAPAVELEREANDAPAPPAATFAITPRSRLETAQRSQSIDRLDLAGLGFPALPADADSAEFDAILDALGLDDGRRKGSRRVLAIAVAGSNGDGLRTALAINLALCAARRGVHVALIDAAERNAKLTRAIRHAAQTPILNQGAFYLAANRVLLALPKGFDAEIGRMRPDELLQSLTRLRDEAIELVICDGPDPGDGAAARILGLVDAVVAFEETPGDEGAQSLWRALADAGVTARALVRFDAMRPAQQKRA